jgi:hypothetical protein
MSASTRFGFWPTLRIHAELMVIAVGLYGLICAAPTFWQDALSRSWPRVPSRVLEYSREFQGKPDAALKRYRVTATYAYECEGQARTAVWTEPSLFLRSGALDAPSAVIRVCPDEPGRVVPEEAIPREVRIITFGSALVASAALASLLMRLRQQHSERKSAGPSR